MIVDVVCLNYADYQAFTPATRAETLALFDKITAYFFKESKQHLTMKFNISIAQSSETTETAFKKERNVSYDRMMFERYKQNSSEVLTNYGEAQAWLIIHSSKKPPKDGAINSPHTSISLIDVPFISINSGASLSTYLHELYHTLGLFDLYTGNISDFVGLADIMSTSTHTEASAYYKKQLGWLEESAYSDSATTDIETITQNGVYTLSAPSAVGKTTAYKFGERNGEFFLAEMRTFPDGATITVF
jgi:M6 family metalloprotease-like protein